MSQEGVIQTLVIIHKVQQNPLWCKIFSSLWEKTIKIKSRKIKIEWLKFRIILQGNVYAPGQNVMSGVKYLKLIETFAEESFICIYQRNQKKQ